MRGWRVWILGAWARRRSSPIRGPPARTPLLVGDLGLGLGAFWAYAIASQAAMGFFCAVCRIQGHCRLPLAFFWLVAIRSAAGCEHLRVVSVHLNELMCGKCHPFRLHSTPTHELAMPIQLISMLCGRGSSFRVPSATKACDKAVLWGLNFFCLAISAFMWKVLQLCTPFVFCGTANSSEYNLPIS